MSRPEEVEVCGKGLSHLSRTSYVPRISPGLYKTIHFILTQSAQCGPLPFYMEQSEEQLRDKDSPCLVS